MTKGGAFNQVWWLLLAQHRYHGGSGLVSASQTVLPYQELVEDGSSICEFLYLEVVERLFHIRSLLSQPMQREG